MGQSEQIEIDLGAAIIVVRRSTYERLRKIIKPPSLLDDLGWWQRNERSILFKVRYKCDQRERPHGQR